MHESSGSSISSSSLSNPISSAKLASTTCLGMTSRTCMQERFQKFKTGGKSDVVKSELDKYLGEDLEVFQKEFDILNWWKVNSHRFSILSKIARDILAVPVSTVASESAFSTGGRVLDTFRSSLSPKIVQALICAHDWLRMNSKPINVEEDLSEIKTIEREEFDWNKPNRPIESLIAKSRTEAATEKIALRKTRCGTPVDFSATHSKFEKMIAVGIVDDILFYLFALCILLEDR
ncbi:UNVERIFIED_CONTAM: Zinc finger BED domain-containing protein RICESLEEPER 2 [Sesamum radiatum]|uniref:Zinc finger BED domain-containing protein RICESLEEPER 2 n=1 Tax=Sesamum radiatum TaxID=300843 RepID=A0AAW2S5G9_SESRA